MILVRVLAHNSRIGVFAENKELLNDPVEAVFQQDEVLEVLVFNMEGRLLKTLKRTGKGTGNGFDKRDYVGMAGMLKKDFISYNYKF